MNVLVACEESQIVAAAFRKKGHKAFSCDLKDCSGGFPEWHIKADALKVLHANSWDLVIAHPPCTILSLSGVRWLISINQRPGYFWNEKVKKFVCHERLKQLIEACHFFNEFVSYFESGKKGVIENPIPHNYAYIPPYSQIVHPYQFGHMEQKPTCLWLYGVPELIPTNDVKKQMQALPARERAKVHYCSPGKNRSTIRSKTYAGIAAAMAQQWG